LLQGRHWCPAHPTSLCSREPGRNASLIGSFSLHVFRLGVNPPIFSVVVIKFVLSFAISHTLITTGLASAIVPSHVTALDEEEADLRRFVEEWRPASTSRSYGCYIEQYKSFASSRGFPLDSSVTLASFIRASALRGLGRQTCTTTIPAAVAHLFRYAPEGNPTSGPLLKAVKAAVGRITQPPVSRVALSLVILKRLGREVDFSSFTSVRDYFLILLMTLGMMRGSEAAALLEDDVEVKSVDGIQVLMIRIQKSKTDQLRVGDTVFLAAGPDNLICPLFWFKLYTEYFRSAGAPNFFHSKKTARSQPSALKGLVPATTCHILKDRLSAIGVDPKGYGSHSCRRGGATAAVAAGVDITLVKRHGRWKSDAVYSYVDDSMRRKLLVSAGIMSGAI
jgi:hypothetical protein